ncbi:MAG: BTAD domain-containing putative transcriptional regulator, partial [Anaerolineales bacterium]
GGERARALRVYHTCATVLERELGVEPSPPTRQAYDDLLNLESVSVQPPKAPFAGLAAAPLVGREREWERGTRRRPVGRWSCWWSERPGSASRGWWRSELWCARNGIATVRSRAYAAEGRLAYAPVIEWLRSEGLRAALSRLEPVWLAEIGRLLPEVLSEHPGRPRPESLTEAEQRQRLFEALARGVLGGTQPLLLVLDDIQWCDHFRATAAPPRARTGPGRMSCALPSPALRSRQCWVD